MRESNSRLDAENVECSPLHQRAKVRRAGVEPAQSGTSGLQPGKLANAQPTQNSQSRRWESNPNLVEFFLKRVNLLSSHAATNSRELLVDRECRFSATNCSHSNYSGMTRVGVEPTKSRRFELRRFACGLRTVSSDQSGIRTHKHYVLSVAALPFAYLAERRLGESNPFCDIDSVVCYHYTKPPCSRGGTRTRTD